VTPGEALLDLDNISLEPEDEGNWQEDANKRIDILQQRIVKIIFDLDSVKPEDLQIEIEQKNQQ
jgi:hypothetical protein